MEKSKYFIIGHTDDTIVVISLLYETFELCFDCYSSMCLKNRKTLQFRKLEIAKTIYG